MPPLASEREERAPTPAQGCSGDPGASRGGGDAGRSRSMAEGGQALPTRGRAGAGRGQRYPPGDPLLGGGGDDDTPPCFQKNQKEEQTHHARSTHSRHSAHASGVGKLGGAGNRQGTPKSPPAPCITRPDRPFAASGLRVINRETSVPPLRTARTPPRPLSSSAGRLPRALQPAPRPPPPPQRIGAAPALAHLPSAALSPIPPRQPLHRAAQPGARRRPAFIGPAARPGPPTRPPLRRAPRRPASGQSYRGRRCGPRRGREGSGGSAAAGSAGPAPSPPEGSSQACPRRAGPQADGAAVARGARGTGGPVVPGTAGCVPSPQACPPARLCLGPSCPEVPPEPRWQLSPLCLGHGERDRPRRGEGSGGSCWGAHGGKALPGGTADEAGGSEGRETTEAKGCNVPRHREAPSWQRRCRGVEGFG